MGAVNQATGMGARGLPGQDGINANTGDFWRSPAGNGALPDGINDVTDTIARSGKVAIGQAPLTTAAPVAQLDVAAAARSGTDRRNPGDPLYVTGALVQGAATITPNQAWVDSTAAKAFIGHSNQTAGFAFGWSTIQQVGATSHEFTIALSGASGQFNRHWAGLNPAAPGLFSNDVVGVALGNGQGWNNRWWAAGVQQAGRIIRNLTTLQGGTQGIEKFWQARRPDGAFVNVHRSTWSFTQPNTPAFSVNPNNHVGDQLLTLHGDPATGAGTFGLGIRSSELLCHVPNGSQNFRWRTLNTGESVLSLLAVNGGILVIDPSTHSAGVGGGNPAIRFGAENSTAQIASNRLTAGRFLGDLELTARGVRDLALLANGRLYLGTVPTFASDAAAGAGGLAVGEVYKDATGLLRIKL